MKVCSKCGKELVDEAVVCPACGCAVKSEMPEPTPAPKPAEPDEVNIGFCVLSALIPLFGVIYWAIKHKETPKKAKACGITALISWGVGIIFYVVFWVIYAAALGALLAL